MIYSIVCHYVTCCLAVPNNFVIWIVDTALTANYSELMSDVTSDGESLPFLFPVNFNTWKLVSGSTLILSFNFFSPNEYSCDVI
jgi:hypothetical protein